MGLRAGQRLLLAAQGFLGLHQLLLVGPERVLHIGNVILQRKNLLMSLHQFLPMTEEGVHHERKRDDEGQDRAGDRLIALRQGAAQQIGLVSLYGSVRARSQGRRAKGKGQPQSKALGRVSL